jgi:hypothetical protein
VPRKRTGKGTKRAGAEKTDLDLRWKGLRQAWLRNARKLLAVGAQKHHLKWRRTLKAWRMIVKICVMPFSQFAVTSTKYTIVAVLMKSLMTSIAIQIPSSRVYL